MATQMFKDMMAELSHDDMVEECFEAVIQLRQLKQQLEGKEQELLEERKEVERLKTVVQGLEAHNRSFSMEIAYLTSRPVLSSMNTASGQDEDEEEEVADVAALSHDGMKEAASKWVVEAANAAGDEWAADDLSA